MNLMSISCIPIKQWQRFSYPHPQKAHITTARLVYAAGNYCCYLNGTFKMEKERKKDRKKERKKRQECFGRKKTDAQSLLNCI